MATSAMHTGLAPSLCFGLTVCITEAASDVCFNLMSPMTQDGGWFGCVQRPRAKAGSRLLQGGVPKLSGFPVGIVWEPG